MSRHGGYVGASRSGASWLDQFFGAARNGRTEDAKFLASRMANVGSRHRARMLAEQRPDFRIMVMAALAEIDAVLPRVLALPKDDQALSSERQRQEGVRHGSDTIGKHK